MCNKSPISKPLKPTLLNSKILNRAVKPVFISTPSFTLTTASPKTPENTFVCFWIPFMPSMTKTTSANSRQNSWARTWINFWKAFRKIKKIYSKLKRKQSEYKYSSKANFSASRPSSKRRTSAKSNSKTRIKESALFAVNTNNNTNSSWAKYKNWERTVSSLSKKFPNFKRKWLTENWSRRANNKWWQMKWRTMKSSKYS